VINKNITRFCVQNTFPNRCYWQRSVSISNSTNTCTW